MLAGHPGHPHSVGRAVSLPLEWDLARPELRSVQRSASSLDCGVRAVRTGGQRCGSSGTSSRVRCGLATLSSVAVLAGRKHQLARFGASQRKAQEAADKLPGKSAASKEKAAGDEQSADANEEKSWWDGFVEFFEALEIVNGPSIEEDDSEEARALTKQIDYIEKLRTDLEEITKKRSYLRDQAEGTLGAETNKLFFLGLDYWRMRVGRVLSKRVVRQGFVNFFSAANVIFIIVFLRTVVPRLLVAENMDDVFLVANELGIPTQANLQATLVGFQEYDFIFKLGLYQLAFILEKVTLISEILPIQIGLKVISPLLFGGLIPGALISATCETIGATVNFFIGRKFFTDRLQTLSFFGGEPLGEAKWFGALNRVAREDGFQLVLLLRLAHVLPLPFDSYWYIFGALPVEFSAFFAAHWLGCLKTAFLDASLGELLLASVTLDSDDRQQFVALEAGGLAIVALAISSIATGLANRLLALEDMEDDKQPAAVKPSGDVKSGPAAATLISAAEEPPQATVGSPDSGKEVKEKPKTQEAAR
mmetsp:Transcript_10025/g.22501  ORF Transcript_10025/g.22501 Transcript_10025/m.22501 type:complete len:535 (-) Transcript_10025:84-1688(-)